LPLNEKPIRGGRYVLYWMQGAQRAECNHALEYAARRANEFKQPLVVVFGLTDEYPEANLRHYTFMLEGLAETRASLKERGIQMSVQHASPDDAAIAAAADASLLVCDSGYLRVQRKWRDRVADDAPCRVVEVETDVIVPVDRVSDKEEYAARTIRPKLHRKLEEYLVPLTERRLKRDSLGLRLGGVEIGNPAKAARLLKLDRTVGAVRHYRGGTSEAKRRLDHFLSNQINSYMEERKEPAADCVSHMSPYLHFGQISPLTVALAIRGKRGVMREAKDAYLEELIIRRELSWNQVAYNPRYDQYAGLPEWSRKTLAHHATDKRDYIYTLDQWENAETHDSYWNAAQKEMVVSGFMHNYMRMYWGKKIIEWSATPEEAFATALYLNNRYELDGRDPNSFVGVAWCFGRHDRPWARRKVFGTVRYMNAAGLERKCDIRAYVRRVAALAKSV